MSEEIECAEGANAAERFRRMVKKVVGVPKAEIERRAKEWREARESEKSETTDE